MTDDFLARVSKASEVWHGESREPADITADFPLYGHQKRAEALTSIDQHISSISEVSGGGEELREYARLMRLRSDLGRIHADLIKVQR